MLELRCVSNKKRCGVCREISFQLEEGFVLGIVGKNGAGKTTLLKSILGEREIEGEIFWNGQNVRNYSYEFLQDIAYIADDAPFMMEEWADTNAEVFGALYETFDWEIFQSEMAARKLFGRRHLHTFSRGEFLGFQLAFARAHGARLYLLDEVTAGMDVVFRRTFYQYLRERLEEEVTILMTTHLQSDLEQVADYVAVMEQGKILSFRANDEDAGTVGRDSDEPLPLLNSQGNGWCILCASIWNR